MTYEMMTEARNLQFGCLPSGEEEMFLAKNHLQIQRVTGSCGMPVLTGAEYFTTTLDQVKWLHFAHDGGTKHGLFMGLCLCAMVSYAASTAFAQSCTTTESGGGIMQAHWTQVHGDNEPLPNDDDTVEAPLYNTCCEPGGRAPIVNWCYAADSPDPIAAMPTGGGACAAEINLLNSSSFEGRDAFDPEGVCRGGEPDLAACKALFGACPAYRLEGFVQLYSGFFSWFFFLSALTLLQWFLSVRPFMRIGVGGA